MSDLNHDYISNHSRGGTWYSTISPTPLPPPVTKTTYKTTHMFHLQLSLGSADINVCLPYF